MTVSPLPGTRDASPDTQISFLGGKGTVVLRVHAVGSRTGYHEGRLEAYSTGTGESFLPSRRFRPGETVAVYALVREGGHEHNVGTTFKIAHPAAERTVGFPHRPGDPGAVQRFRSAPRLTPTKVKVITPARKGAAEGDFFLAPYQGAGKAGPMIVDRSGGLIWFHPVPAGESATNFQVQSYEGKPVLTWWQGHILKLGFGQGEDVIYDSSYRKIATVKAGNGYLADLHEIRLTPEGAAWIDAFYPVHMGLAREHGSKQGVLTDSVIEEVDVKTGLVMWQWHALGHIPLSASHNPAPATSYPWDYVHINSVDPGKRGDVLLSSRNTWTLYDVSLHTGAFNWTLGDGGSSSFKLGNGVRFYWQHDAEWEPGGDISLFDNGASPAKEKQSSGLLLHLDRKARSVSLVKRFVNPSRRLLAASQGNVERLPGGTWLVGYGELPSFTEFDSAGHVLFDATLGRNVQDFRTYESPWSGRPYEPPALAAQATGGGVTAEMSWNGATEVASWRLLAGSSPTSLTPVANATRTGFETTVRAPSARFVEAQALSASGTVIWHLSGGHAILSARVSGEGLR